jgi:hypothetical protein
LAHVCTCRLTTTACGGPRNQTPLLTWGVHTSPFAFATPQATRHSMHSLSQLSAIARMHLSCVASIAQLSPRTMHNTAVTHLLRCLDQPTVCILSAARLLPQHAVREQTCQVRWQGRLQLGVDVQARRREQGACCLVVHAPAPRWQSLCHVHMCMIHDLPTLLVNTLLWQSLCHGVLCDHAQLWHAMKGVHVRLPTSLLAKL